MTRKMILVGVILLLVLVVGGLFFRFGILSRRLRVIESSQIGDSVNIPGEVILNEVFVTLEGEDTNIRQFLNNGADYILVDIWATWCSPCVAALVDYQKNIEFFREHNIEIVAVSVGEPKNVVINFIEKHGITYKMLLDLKQKTMTEWNLRGIPTAFLLNKEGKVILSTLGYGSFGHTKFQIEHVLKKEKE